MTKEQVLKQIDLAQRANWYTNFQDSLCECVSMSIGVNPCDYCLIFFALKHAKEFISEVIEAEIVSDKIFTKLEDKP